MDSSIPSPSRSGPSKSIGTASCTCFRTYRQFSQSGTGRPRYGGSMGHLCQSYASASFAIVRSRARGDRCRIDPLFVSKTAEIRRRADRSLCHILRLCTLHRRILASAGYPDRVCLLRLDDDGAASVACHDHNRHRRLWCARETGYGCFVKTSIIFSRSSFGAYPGMIFAALPF